MSQAKVKATRLKAARVSTKAQSAHVLQQQQEIVDHESHNFRLGDTTTQNGSTILTVFHVKESKFDVDKRIQQSHIPYQYSPIKRFADTSLYRQVLPIPLRPVWNNHNTREQLQQNEIDKFDQYLQVIYDSIPPSRLTHFEHNLDVWRQLWRVCEISDVLCACVDARHPLFHFPPALFDFIVKKLKKPLILILNKIDLVPKTIINAWERFLKRIYPDVHIIKFSSHPNAINDPTLQQDAQNQQDKDGSMANFLSDDTIRLTRGMAVQGGPGAGIVHKSQPLGSPLLKTFWNIVSYIVENQHLLPQDRPNPTGPIVTNELIAFALDYARRIGANDGSNTNSLTAPQFTYDLGQITIPDTVLVTDSQEAEEKSKRNANRQFMNKMNVDEDGNPTDDLLGDTAHSNDHDRQLILQKMKELELLAQDDSSNSATSTTTTTKTSTNQSDELDMDTDGIDMEDSMGNTQTTMNFKLQKKIALTIGMVGHPNAGKSSLINAILGRPAVSVSNTPGHTKHLQTLTTIPNCSNSIRLCDSPGIVFPAVDISRSLQTLLGIFPHPKLAEPYTCVQFLAERLPLVNLYQLKPYFGPDSDAVLHGASHPGGHNSAFVENYQQLMLQGKYNGSLAKEEIDKKVISIPSNQTADIHPVFVDGIVTSPIPEEISGGTATQSTAKTASSAPPTNPSAPQPILVNGIDISLLAPTASNNKKKSNGKGSKTAQQKNPAQTPAAQSKATDLFDTLDQLLIDSRFDSYTNPRYVWSAWRICEAYAVKKRWYTESSGKPDTFKAGMAIVKDCVDGRLNLYFLPPQLQLFQAQSGAAK